MNHVSKNRLSEAQKELVTFINPVDAPDIANSLKRVYAIALFEKKHKLTESQKDDLFYLEKIITLTQNI